MKLEQLKVIIKASNKVFIWSSLSANCGAFFNVSKSALADYLSSIASEDDFIVELDEIGDLYLGGITES